MSGLKTDLKDPKDTGCASVKNKRTAMHAVLGGAAGPGQPLTAPKANGVPTGMFIPQVVMHKSFPDQ